MPDNKFPLKYKEPLKFDPRTLLEPKFLFDSHGRLIMPFSPYQKMTVSALPGSKNVVTGSEDKGSTPMNDPAAIKSGYLHASSVLKAGPKGGWVARMAGGNSSYPFSFYNETTKETRFWIDSLGEIYCQALHILSGSGIANLTDAGDLALVDTADFATQVSGDEKPSNNADVTEDSNFVQVTYPSDQADIQIQIDGKIVSWFTDADPSLTWVGSDEGHNGDMWWNTTTKKLKRWDGTAWSIDIEDQRAIDAYANAASAQDTADGKRRVFVAEPTTPYDVGDLWSDGPTGDLKKCKTARATGAYQAGDWELASKYDKTEESEFVTVTYPADKSDLQTQIDGKIISWFQETDPNTWSVGDRPKHDGDMWYKESTHLLKRYDSDTNTWELIEDQKAIDAYANAADAQDTADGKRRVFTAQPTTPYDIGDLWSAGPAGEIKKCKTARASGAYQSGDWELASKYDKTSENTAKDIFYLPAVPSGSGLFCDNSHMGYHDGSDWKAYIGSNGHFYFKGDDDNRIYWNGSALIVRGQIVADDILAGGTITGNTIRTGDGGSRIEMRSHGEGSWPDEMIFYNLSGNAVLQIRGGAAEAVFEGHILFPSGIGLTRGVGFEGPFGYVALEVYETEIRSRKILPLSDEEDLGSWLWKWRDLYLRDDISLGGNITVGGTLKAGGATVDIGNTAQGFYRLFATYIYRNSTGLIYLGSNNLVFYKPIKLNLRSSHPGSASTWAYYIYYSTIYNDLVFSDGSQWNRIYSTPIP